MPAGYQSGQVQMVGMPGVPGLMQPGVGMVGVQGFPGIRQPFLGQVAGMAPGQVPG